MIEVLPLAMWADTEDEARSLALAWAAAEPEIAGVTIVACVQERYRWWRVDVSIRWRTATLGL